MWISIVPKLGGRRALKRFSKTVLRGNWHPRTMGYLPQHERRETRPRMRAQYALCGLPSPMPIPCSPRPRKRRALTARFASRSARSDVIIRSNRRRTPAATERNRFGKAAFVVTANVSQGKKSDRLEGAAHFRLRARDEAAVSSHRTRFNGAATRNSAASDPRTERVLITSIFFELKPICDMPSTGKPWPSTECLDSRRRPVISPWRRS